MRVFGRLLAAAAACVAVTMPVATAARAVPSGTPRPANAESGFALALLRQLGGEGNLVYSPYSVDVALTMADAGAAGPTASQIARVLDARSPSVAVAEASSLRHALSVAVGSGTGAPTLDVANALWTQSGLVLQPPFVSTLTSSFGAPPRSTDFAGNPAAALRAINAWVSEHTNALIPSLLAPGSVTAQTAFVLANAIYLKAHWQNPFMAPLTQPAPFTTQGGQVVRVPFMNQQRTTYGYYGPAAYQAIALPYSDSSLSLLAIMPRAGTLTSFDRGLTARSLATIAARLRPESVNLSMPKVDLSSEESLNQPLQALGMTDAFGGAANFSGVTTQRSLSISLVEHAAVLKIDEAGTVAAGATAIVGPTAVAPVPNRPIDVVLNRPYLLLLRDEASGAILFVARVENPSQS